MMTGKRAVIRVMIVVIAYLLLGPVWFRTSVDENGYTTHYKRLGVFKWMELKRYTVSENPRITKGGAFTKWLGVITTVVAFSGLLSYTVVVERKTAAPTRLLD